MLDTSLVDLSRMQFALTAMFHWIFVPLTLGLGFIIAFMETIYVKTGNEFWKKTEKFWMNIFAINFAIGVATGLILEFQFGTNWSNYSWFVGDIFGAPLAIEGIFAFFMETTFFAIMFFGWNKVSKKAHLTATWLTAIGTVLSAIWILVANAWMQYPIGMEFNPDTARNEMVDFWAILFSPVAINKIIHTVTNAFVLATIVVIGISSWYLIKNKFKDFALKSIKIAAPFGLISLLILIWTGDESGYQVARHQPMKLAAIEGLYESKIGTPLVAIGIINPKKTIYNDVDPVFFDINIPQGLSLLANRELNSFVPGIQDIINGGYTYIDYQGKEIIAPSFEESKRRGKIAINSLREYNTAKIAEDKETAEYALKNLRENFDYFGYGYLDKPEDSIPNVALVFYSFRIMVGIGVFLLILLVLIIIYQRKGKLENKRWILYLGVLSIPLVYVCSQAGWIVSEVGRQPWTIQNLLPVQAAVSGNSSSDVLTTLIIFFLLFSILLTAELKILYNQIKKGPQL